MAEKITRQFGLWDSPISPESISRERRLEAVRWDSDQPTLVWLEGRSGHGVLVAHRLDGDAPGDLTSDIDVRAQVGYGGGDFTVWGGHVYFVQHKTGRIYRQPLAGGPAKPITPPFGKAASPAVSPDSQWVAYVHHDDQTTDCLAMVDTSGTHWPQILSGGNDFYMQPRWSPGGSHLAWIAWDHPNMPWDGTTLQLAPVVQSKGHMPKLGPARVVAGGPDTAIFQPEFTPDGRQLVFVSDQTGWGRISAVEITTGQTRWLTPEGVEYATPAWVQDQRTFAITGDGRYVIAARSDAGVHQMVRIELATSETVPIESLRDYQDIAQVVTSHQGDWVSFIGSSPMTPPRIVCYNGETHEVRIALRSATETIPPSALAHAEPISWSTPDGERAHGLYYHPASDRFQAEGKPPLIVIVHGGPTSQARAGWRPEAQFFATRGYAVLYVNYRGSTGYGRQYMLELRGKWGVHDVEDSISGARFLADSGKIDRERTVIMGGSAGGFTVLQTMVDHPEAFTAGVNLFGVSDQFQLVATTHKFESRYSDSILGPLPEAASIYRARSPLFHADKIRRPLAIYQGDIDRVVPRQQSDAIVEALKRNGTPHVYHVYQNEGHGWRKQQTIEHYYRSVEEFLRQYVIFR
jgi:dipeptidyl aminopeptidase/acylaminoacyl peptidase